MMDFRFNGLDFFISDILSPFVRLFKLDIHQIIFKCYSRLHHPFDLVRRVCEYLFHRVCRVVHVGLRQGGMHEEHE